MAETTDALIERHRRAVDMMALHHARRHGTQGPEWLRETDRIWVHQQRAFEVEDLLLKRAETEDKALSYMSEYLGVTDDPNADDA